MMLTVAVDPMKSDKAGANRLGELKLLDSQLSRNLPWTKGEDQRLREFVAQGASVIPAAAALRRTTIEVRTRARDVGCPFPTLRIERQKWANTPDHS
jgi:hypothetical protein